MANLCCMLSWTEGDSDGTVMSMVDAVGCHTGREIPRGESDHERQQLEMLARLMSDRLKKG